MRIATLLWEHGPLFSFEDKLPPSAEAKFGKASLITVRLCARSRATRRDKVVSGRAAVRWYDSQ